MYRYLKELRKKHITEMDNRIKAETVGLRKIKSMITYYEQSTNLLIR